MKRGIKPGTKFSAAHREAISRGHMGLQVGEKNPNYKHDRKRIKVGAMSFTLTADIKAWLDTKPNKSKYIQSLIRQDMEKQQQAMEVGK